ncbi:hypothetical protein GGGNBK_01325 [Sporosarcina sp. ANT_H38]
MHTENANGSLVKITEVTAYMKKMKQIKPLGYLQSSILDNYPMIDRLRSENSSPVAFATIRWKRRSA